MIDRFGSAARAAALLLSALLAACATQPLNPFGRAYDEENVLQPGPLAGCKGNYDVPPYLEFGSKTMYPATQHMNAYSGDVVVEFRVDAQGRVTPLTAAEGPARAFINHNNLAMKDWRVRPATWWGTPVEVVCRLQQSYRIIGPYAPVREDNAPPPERR